MQQLQVYFYRTAKGKSPVEEYISGLPKDDLARFTDVYKGIKEYGLAYARVHLKHLRGKLWEIKFSARSGGYRIAYVMISQTEMIWLHAFAKKTQKTPIRDLETAENRMMEVLKK